MYDYIIVGFGLAGMSFAEQLRTHNKRFLVINDDSQQSSRVAGGLYNPVILKRFTLAWDAQAHLNTALTFYEGLESHLNLRIKESLPIFRRFTSIKEQNSWIAAADKPSLAPFLSSTLQENTNPALDMPYHCGEVLHTGRIRLAEVLQAYLSILDQKGHLLRESCEYSALDHADGVFYKGLRAKHIVFCEGYGVVKNPYFEYLPLLGNKGEYLTIRAPALRLNAALKAGIFILPLGDDLYKVGATYDHKDKSSEPTRVARLDLERKLKKVLKVDYEVVSQVAGIRPTTKDRKPLLGTHPKYPHMHILNGFGSRGVLVGPAMGSILYAAIEKGKPIDSTIAIDRFV